VRALIAEILDGAERDGSECPRSFTHRDLACVVYATEAPTAAQESAVRRAVAALVAAGRAERLPFRNWLRPSTGTHRRRSTDGSYVYQARNPVGIRVRRTLTLDDQEAQERWLSSPAYAEFEEELARLSALVALRGRL
jgi:hypothetical protein